MAETPQTAAVVWLASGGPKMTINREVDAKSVECVWFEGAELYRAVFHRQALLAYDPEAEGGAR